jgi:hypothetical protein
VATLTHQIDHGPVLLPSLQMILCHGDTFVSADPQATSKRAGLGRVSPFEDATS